MREWPKLLSLIVLGRDLGASPIQKSKRRKFFRSQCPQYRKQLSKKFYQRLRLSFPEKFVRLLSLWVGMPFRILSPLPVVTCRISWWTRRNSSTLKVVKLYYSGWLAVISRTGLKSRLLIEKCKLWSSKKVHRPVAWLAKLLWIYINLNLKGAIFKLPSR